MDSSGGWEIVQKDVLALAVRTRRIRQGQLGLTYLGTPGSGTICLDVFSEGGTRREPQGAALQEPEEKTMECPSYPDQGVGPPRSDSQISNRGSAGFQRGLDSFWGFFLSAFGRLWSPCGDLWRDRARQLACRPADRCALIDPSRRCISRAGVRRRGCGNRRCARLPIGNLACSRAY
jgi:hypothetical protein